MKEIMTLTKMQLGSALEFLMISRKKKSHKKQMSVWAVIGAIFALFAFISGTYSYSMGVVLDSLGQIDVLPGLFMALTCMLLLVTTIYKVKGTLFGFKDYDIVMSLPVSTGKVVASRLLLLYIIDIVIAAGFLIPCFIAYGILAKPAVSFYILSIIALIFIPLVPLVIASVIGTIIAFFAGRYKHSNLLNIVLMIVLLGAFLAGSFMLQNDEQLAEIGTMLESTMRKTYPLSTMFLKGVLEADVVSYLIFIAISVISFALFSVVTGRLFKHLNGTIMSRHVSSNYTLKEQKASTAYQALLKKEWKRYFASTIYVMNTAVGLIMLLIGAVVFCIIKPAQVQMIFNEPQLLDMIRSIVPYGIAVMAGMTAITGCSISLEGKNLWILKSSPVPAKTIFNAKMSVSLIMTLPVILVTGILFGITCKADFLQMIWILVIPALFAWFTALFGLIINLKFPMFDWTNEAVVVKQSASSMLSVSCPMIIMAVPVVLMIIVGVPELIVAAGTCIVVLISCILMKRYLDKNGDRILASL